MSNLNPFRRKIQKARTGIRSKKLGTWTYDRNHEGKPVRHWKGKLLTA